MKNTYYGVSAIIFLSGNLVAIDGNLDTTFNSAGAVPGITTTAIELGSMVSTAIQADGKIIVASISKTEQCILARYQSNGILDPLFGTGGIVYGPFTNRFDWIPPFVTYTVGPALIIQPDSKIIVGLNGPGKIARFTNNGDLDISFGTGGIVTLPLIPIGGLLQEDIVTISAIVLQQDNKLLCVGNILGSQGEDREGVVIRLHKNGVIDTSFGSNGIYKAQPNFGTAPKAIYAAALQPDNSLVIGGLYGYDAGANTGRILLQRILPNGTIDTSFGTNGEVITQISTFDGILSLLIQPDGKIIAGGWSGDSFNFALVRYTSQGVLDTSDFNSPHGYVLTEPISRSYSSINAMGVQADRKIVVAGETYDPESSVNFVVARYTTDGLLDTTQFGTNGIVHTAAAELSAAYAVAIQPDGNLIAAGGYGATYVGDFITGFGVARYLVANTPLTTTNITYPPSGQTFTVPPTFLGNAQDPSLVSLFIDDSLNDADTVFTTTSNEWSIEPTRSTLRSVFPPGTYTYRGVSYYPNGRSQQETEEGSFTIQGNSELLNKISLLSEKLLSKQCSETQPATSALTVALHNKICTVS